ncbi:MAG: YceI family protein [Deltaproteobacteria bacterium]|nr:YceI family protein [Deltaproteobacteria bacterium]
MKKLIPSLLALTLLALPSLASASTWQVDAAHATVGFEVSHLMISKVRGSFDEVQATLELDEKNLANSKVKATIAASSIDTGNEKRDGHLKSGDFFDVAAHPALTFESTKVKKAGKNKLKVTGNLTIKGVSKPVTLDVTYTDAVKSPFAPIRIRGFTATTTIDRTDWGLTWNKALETGGVLVGEEIAITLSLEFQEEAEAKTASR